MKGFGYAAAGAGQPRYIRAIAPIANGILRLPYHGKLNERNSMNSNKALWEKGDFTKIAAFMRESGEAVVRSLDITSALRILDLGCGDGTTAIPLASMGAEVVGIDIARNLVTAGNERAAQTGLVRLK